VLMRRPFFCLEKSMDDEEGVGQVPPHPAHAAHESPSPAKGGGAKLRVCAGKNRIVQVASAGSRKLFDARRREVFLEWFAATCNVRLAAAKAGVAYQTVFKHRMKDPAFAADWDVALAQGYARLEARPAAAHRRDLG
jgi:hypothetical protein